MKRIFLVVFALCAASWLYAQEYPISTGYIQTCSAFLVDNGLSANDYGPNENSTTTICPDGTGAPIINLYFASFFLGVGDTLRIFNGSNNAAPLMGAYSGNALQGQDIFSSNDSGCLTVVFTSNADASVGSFGAEVSCGLPCARPTAVISNDVSNLDTARICIGETITFNGAQSVFQNGTHVGQFTWDFDDGTPDNSTDWPMVSHSFSESGAYIVQLYLRDDNDCSSANLPDMVVLVATEPEISVTSDDYQVCIGQEVNLSGAVTPVTWSALPDANFGGALFIPDNQTQCFSSELLFGSFSPGQTVESINDLTNVYINFEHSYMGDLVISLICPNGQSLLLHNLGGADTFLGVPVDDESNVPGIGWDYYWAPNATNGTWAQMGNWTTLASGTYQSVGPWSSLIGCPLNGVWEIEVCDMWYLDNGFIFDWAVNFNEALYPDLISFTPSFENNCTATFWAGQNIQSTSPNCDQIVVVPTSPGNFTYTYSATDNHGCTFTKDIGIQAYPGPVPNAGEDAPYCNTPLTLNGSITNPVQGINYSYSWAPSQFLNNSQSAAPTVTGLQQPTVFTLSVYPLNDPQCVIADEVLVTIPDSPPASAIDSLEICLGETVVLLPVVDDEIYHYTWTYSPTGDGEPTVVQENEAVFYAGETGYYWLEIEEPVCHFSSLSPYYVAANSCSIRIPNIFTPNGDKQNNSFFIKGLENFPNSGLVIFNRWGAKVFESDNYKNDWAPEDLSEGTYYYILGIKKKNNSVEYFEGNVTLMRN